MANELKHGSVGTELTQAEWEGIGAHVLESQAAGDIIYAHSTSQLRRLAKGTDTHVLILSSGVPAWSATTGITAVGTITSDIQLDANLDFIGAQSITTSAGDLALDPAASLNVTLTDDDVDAMEMSNSASLYYRINTQNLVSGTAAHLFDSEDATIASGAAQAYELAHFRASTLNYTGAINVTGLIQQVRINPWTIASNTATLTVNKSAILRLAAPVEGTNVILTDAAALWLNNTTGTPANQHGIYIEDMTAGGSDYGLTIEGADTAAIWVSSAADTTDAANGIAFGSSRDTNLYRGAANTLATDDSLRLAGALIVDGTTDASSGTTGSIQTDGGLGVAKDIISGANIKTEESFSWGNFTGDRRFTLNSKGIADVSTSAVTIATNGDGFGSNGIWCIVVGNITGQDKAFFDIVVAPEESGGTPVVIQAINTRGTPDARTYTVSAERTLQLAMAANTYQVSVGAIEIPAGGTGS